MWDLHLESILTSWDIINVAIYSDHFRRELFGHCVLYIVLNCVSICEHKSINIDKITDGIDCVF